jgi:hypothetical protein
LAPFDLIQSQCFVQANLGFPLRALQSIGSKMMSFEVMGHQLITRGILEDIAPSSNPSTNTNNPFNHVKRRSKHDIDLFTMASLDNPTHLTKQLSHSDTNLIARMIIIGILIIRKTLLISLRVTAGVG